MKVDITTKDDISINSRSRIEYRYTTNPGDLGYDGRASSWLENKPAAIGTPKTIREKVKDLKRIIGLGSGVYYREKYTCQGVECSQELDEYEFDLEWEKSNSKK